tara:strand:- start:1494 stop:1733 length:240 start_codon:yes stop_codon:yes gene_type:complete
MTTWLELKQGILNDELPKNKDKYVKFSNLGDINKRMVIYYLKKGFKSPAKQKKYLSGILEEMSKDSDIRGYIEGANRRK